MKPLSFAKDYKGKNEYPFPSDDIDQDEKTKPGYFLACSNSIMSKFFNNLGGVPYDAWGDRRSFAELRAYRTGKNSPNKYKSNMLGHKDENANGKTTVNISWDIPQILPQKMDSVKGFLQKVNYSASAEAVDYQALLDKKTMIALAKIMADPRLKQMQEQVNQIAGQPIIQEKDASEWPGGMRFNTPEEVDVAAQVGVFYMQEEAALQNLIDKTQYESGSDGVNDKVKDDLMTLGYAGKKVYTNQNTSIVLEDYVDMDNAVLPWSVYDDYRDITWAGEVKRYSIARLRREYNLPEEKLIEIARKYQNANPASVMPGFFKNIHDNNLNTGFGMNMIDQIEVDVMDCRWYGTKHVNFTDVSRKDGVRLLYKVGDNYELPANAKKDNKTLNKYSNTTVYKAKVVVGSDCVFDYGEDNDISYKKDIQGRMYPEFPYKFSRTGTSSLVERCVSYVDDACISMYKLRIARKTMPAPPNVYIDKSALEGMKIDGVSYKPHQLLRLLQNEGYLIGDSKNQWGNNTGAGQPIRPIGTDLMSVIAGWWEDMGRSIDMIEKVTGINDVFAAQSPERQTGLGVSNLLVQGAQNSFTPILKAYEYIFEQSLRVVVAKWQIVAVYMPKAERDRLAISRSLETVAITDNMKNYDFSIQIEATTTEQERQQMMLEITQMRDAARAGATSGIDEHDYLVISQMIRTGKITQAQLYTANAVQRRKKEAQEEQEKLIQMNAQTQQQSAQQKGQLDQQSIAMEGDIDLRNEVEKAKVQGEYQLRLEALRGANARSEKAMEAVYGNKKSA